MEIIPFVAPKDFSLVLGGDIHSKDVMFHKEGFTEMINYVRLHKHCYFAGTGDYANAIASDDKRFDLESLSLEGRQPMKELDNLIEEYREAKASKKQRNISNALFKFLEWKRPNKKGATPIGEVLEIAEMFKPIQKKIIVLGDANHESKHHRVGNLVRDILCENLGVPYGTISYKINILDSGKKNTCKVFHWHGHGNIRSYSPDPKIARANEEMQLRRKLYRLAGDCVWMNLAHTHKLIVRLPLTEELYLTDEDNKIKQHYTEDIVKEQHSIDGYVHPDFRWYSASGSFLKLHGKMGVSGYAEKAGYTPVDLGFVVGHFQNRQLVKVEAIRV